MDDYLEMFIPLMATLSVISLVSMWRIFLKAGMPGWAILIPVYNLIVLLKIVKKPTWWLLLFLIPFVNVIYSVWITNLLSKSFGKGTGFTLGLLFLSFIFYPLLAFGEAIYVYEERNEKYNDISEKARANIVIIVLAVLLLGPVLYMLFTRGGILGMDNFVTLGIVMAIYNSFTLITPLLFGISLNIKHRNIGIVLGSCLVIANSFGYSIFPQLVQMLGDNMY